MDSGHARQVIGMKRQTRSPGGNEGAGLNPSLHIRRLEVARSQSGDARCTEFLSMDRQFASLPKTVGADMNNAPQRRAPKNGNPAFGQLTALDRAEGVTLAGGAVDKNTVYTLLNQSSGQSLHRPQV